MWNFPLLVLSSSWFLVLESWGPNCFDRITNQGQLCGLGKHVIIIMITASLSSNTYNKAYWCENWTFEENKINIIQIIDHSLRLIAFVNRVRWKANFTWAYNESPRSIMVLSRFSPFADWLSPFLIATTWPENYVVITSSWLRRQKRSKTENPCSFVGLVWCQWYLVTYGFHGMNVPRTTVVVERGCRVVRGRGTCREHSPAWVGIAWELQQYQRWVIVKKIWWLPVRIQRRRNEPEMMETGRLGERDGKGVQTNREEETTCGDRADGNAERDRMGVWRHLYGPEYCSACGPNPLECGCLNVSIESKWK